MPKKILLAILLVVFAFTIFLQASRVTAEEAPITSPVTPPITTPVSFFNLTGKVTYKKLGHFFRSANRVIPAANVAIRVRGFFNSGQKYETKTDANGNYSIQVPAGLYRVHPSDSQRTFFSPPFKVVKLKEGKVKTANFQGLQFRW